MERRSGDNLTDEKKASKLRTTQISECLKEERAKAFKCLQARTNQGDKEKRITNGSIHTQYAATSTTASSAAHVPYSRYRDDISDLISNTSITLHISDFSMPKDTDTDDLSFHPAEMTGRSTTTQQSGDSKPSQKPINYSVDQILATSFVDQVREWRNSNIGGGGGGGPSGSISSGNRLSSASSCISGFSAMQKNPRLTYMPSSSSIESKTSRDCISGFSFHGNQMNYGDVDDEEFKPAEMMRDQLLEDEIEWAKEHAVVPTAVLSDEARKKLPMSSANMSQFSNLNSTSLKDLNFSFGKFFSHGSANIDSMIQKSNATKREHAPVALIDDSTTDTTISTTYDDDSPEKSKQIYYVDLTTPTNKQNSELDTIMTSLIPEKHHSKDSGNATEKSDRLRSLEIDRILATNQTMDEADRNLNNGDLETGASKEITNIIMENKENIQLYGNCSKDTLSFTESLLNTSIQNYRMSNVGQARSPLSPIPIMITETTEDDADVDEFLNSPVVTPLRHKRFTKKSPRSLHLSSIAANGQNVEETLTEQLKQLPENAKITSVEHVAISVTPCLPVPVAETGGRNQKSLSSTRLLHGDRNSAAIDSQSEILSNLSKNTCTRALTPTYNNGVNTYEISPLSSPCSYLSSLPVSPMNSDPTINIGNHNHNKGMNKNCCCSPSGGLRRVATSPCHSEPCTTNKYNNTGTNQCGSIAPMRTYSSNSVKSCDGTSTSSNSEFSHRDGKIMPIKVTAFKLSWASVKLQTESQKSLQIKNTSNKRLNLRVEITGPGFKLINPDNNMLTLSSQERRTIIVNFNPTVIGPAIGKLLLLPPRVQNFRSLNPQSLINANSNAPPQNHEVTIQLYAYGGHAQIAIQNLSRGPVGAPYLTMGEFCTLVRPMERTLQIYNRGPLLGFAAMHIEANGSNLNEICRSLKVEPEWALIPPQTAVTIRIIFEPNQNDIRKMRNYIVDEVMTLAKLRIIYGDEAIRQRLRQVQRAMTVEEREKIFTQSLDTLWEIYPGESNMFPPGVFKDSGKSVAQDMWACISEKAVALTINNNMLDETAAELSTIFTEADNTILFRTVCISPLTKTDESSHPQRTNNEYSS